MTRPPRRWLSAFGRHDWDESDRTYATLLDSLTRDRLEAEALERELSRPAEQVTADERALEQREIDEARQELDEFRAALTDARQRGADGGEVPYDSADPREDAAADVLIQYLVRPGYAEVRTEEPQPQHYVYYVHIDWPKLRELASRRGNTLPD